MRFHRLAGLALAGVATASCVSTPERPAPVPAPPPPAAAREVAPPERRAFILEGMAQQGGVMIGSAPSNTAVLTLDGRPVEMASDGGFLIGFDRDQGREAMLMARLAGGGEVRRPIKVSPSEWKIERLSTLPRFPAPRPEFARMRDPELAQIAAARRIVTGSQGWRQRFQWPVTGRISGWFGSQRVYRGEPGAYHSGVDVAKPAGTVLAAPADGVVILAAERPFTLEGNLLMIDHGMGLNSAFLHLSRIDVRVGDRVSRGQPIGAVGATGRATGPHMHWGMKWGDARIDPLLLAGPMPGA
jgi:hypothetical protein